MSTDSFDLGLGHSAKYALCRLCERLMNEGYIYTERIPELSERTHNMERGDGFLTNAELKEKSRKTPDELEDLLA